MTRRPLLAAAVGFVSCSALAAPVHVQSSCVQIGGAMQSSVPLSITTVE
jgi:hypothetical protein